MFRVFRRGRTGGRGRSSRRVGCRGPGPGLGFRGCGLRLLLFLSGSEEGEIEEEE